MPETDTQPISVDSLNLAIESNPEQETPEEAVKREHQVDEVLEALPLVEILRRYNIEPIHFQERQDGYLELPVRAHFSKEIRIPAPYSYKGGAARALLMRTLQLENPPYPRDVDLVRIGTDASYPDQDKELAQRYMERDFEFGDGIEFSPTESEYLKSRDFTINEVSATDQRIVCTRQCLLDTVRGIIRLTQFEVDRNIYYDQPSNKMLAKILRLYSDARTEGRDIQMPDVNDSDLEGYFISPFWLAVQLDRAHEISYLAAESYIEVLREKHQLPPGITTVEEARDYLLELLEGGFVFRSIDPQRDHIDEKLLQDEAWRLEYNDFDNLPKFEGLKKWRKTKK